MTDKTGHETRTREAAEWFARLKQRRVDRADVEAFSVWRRTPENAAAFARLEQMWDAAGVLAEDPEMIALTREALEAQPLQRRRGRPAAWKPVAATALSAIALIGVGGVWWFSRPQIHSAGFGEREEIRLADGSTVQLDSGSRIAVRIRGAERRIELLEGEGLFEVRPDPARPFVVTAGDTRIVALGTRFDVRRRGPEVRVVLLEGRVRVEADGPEAPRAWTLSPRQQITPTSTDPVVADADVSSATSWTAGRLTFERTPLVAAIAEVNRYSRVPIRLRVAELEDVEVSGVFNTGDVDGFVSAVTALYPVRVMRAGDEIVLEPATRK